MLKRQRQPSPPPSSPSIPIVAESPADLVERNSKRRRTAAPVLDGTARGWAPEQAPPDDDEEYTYSDDEQDVAHGPHPYPLQSQSEYTSANTMLRELHTMHQHRLLFSSPSEGQNSNTPLSPNPLDTTPLNRYHPPTSDKTHLPLQNEQMQSAYVSQSIDKGLHSDGLLMEEAIRVAELYEGPNKYLGSLFLSRRRKLDSSDEIPGT
ncbi:hypothetical protein BJ912DRAFT_943493 [Pholiota molesta]|nr:hypothetical protein BJ912DRAFT_943493 [Pholiota molesta]